MCTTRHDWQSSFNLLTPAEPLSFTDFGMLYFGIFYVYPQGAFVKTANLSDNKIMIMVIGLILLIMTRALWMPITM